MAYGRMAKAAKSSAKGGARRRKKPTRAPTTLRGRLWRWLWRGSLGFGAFLLLWVLLYTVINPPITPYMLAEKWRYGPLDREWVDIEDVAPALARSIVAAEDANFCLHWGFDMKAIRAALDEGANRGASTITQQVVKNTFLWHGRSWPRKALEALLTPLVELTWSKRRILEVYLNVAEYGEGVFGVEAAALRAFNVPASDVSAVQAARLAVVLPNPKERNAAKPTAYLRGRAAAALDGAATIKADGRASCFED